MKHVAEHVALDISLRKGYCHSRQAQKQQRQQKTTARGEWQNAKESLENEANLHSNFRDNFSHLVAEGSIQRLMNTVIAHSRELLEAERASLFLYDEESNELWSQVAEGIDEEIRISADSGLAGACFRSKKVVNVKEALKDPRFVSSIDYQTGFQTKGVLVAPVFNKEGDKVIGIIEALNKITERYLKVGKKVHLKFLSNDCQKLLKNADKLIEVNVLEDPKYKVVVDNI